MSIISRVGAVLFYVHYFQGRCGSILCPLFQGSVRFYFMSIISRVGAVLFYVHYFQGRCGSILCPLFPMSVRFYFMSIIPRVGAVLFYVDYFQGRCGSILCTLLPGSLRFFYVHLQFYFMSIISRVGAVPVGRSPPPGHWRVSTTERLENSSHCQNKTSWTALEDTVNTPRVRQKLLLRIKGARWRKGRASGSESRGPGFDPHRRHRVASLSKTH